MWIVDAAPVRHRHREIRELATREPGTVSIYLCGPTVYGPPHLGHGRATVEYDILLRYLRWRGLKVRLVSNITDIDDKIIERADTRGARGTTSPTSARRCGGRAWTGSTWPARRHTPRHGLGRPDGRPDRRARRPDKAYTTDDGVYLSVDTVPDYGLLAQQSLDQLRAGGGDRTVVGAEHKRDPADFALWKLAKPGEPAWPSPWGDGRPGWHTECVVMSLELLGEGFDLHCGGIDLKFPHHENERAQAVALGKRFANHWMHHAFVVDAEGEKMSKSLGNVDNLLDLIETVRSPRLPDGAAAGPLPQPGHGRPTSRRRPSGRWVASTPSPPASVGGAAGAPPTGGPRRVRRGDGRRPRHADGHGGGLRHGARANAALDAVTSAAGRSSRRCSRWPRPSGWS